MRAYIIRRLLILIPTLLLLTIVIFLLVRLVPGDMVEMIAAEQEDITGLNLDTIRHELGLDVPVHIQYGCWLGVLPNNAGRFVAENYVGGMLSGFIRCPS